MNASINISDVAKALFKDFTAQIEERIKRDGRLPPHFMIYTNEGRLLVLEPASLDDDTKPKAYAAVRCACIAHGASIITFLYEAWSLSYDPKLPFPAIRPSQSERRIEVAFVVCCWLEAGEKRQLFSFREIIRNAEGGVAGLGTDLNDGKSAEIGGVLGDLLPAQSFDRAARRRAKRDFEQMCRLGIIKVQELDTMTSN